MHKWKTPGHYPLPIEVLNVDGPDEPIVLERLDAALVDSVERRVGPEIVDLRNHQGTLLGFGPIDKCNQGSHSFRPQEWCS